MTFYKNKIKIKNHFNTFQGNTCNGQHLLHIFIEKLWHKKHSWLVINLSDVRVLKNWRHSEFIRLLRGRFSHSNFKPRSDTTSEERTNRERERKTKRTSDKVFGVWTNSHLWFSSWHWVFLSAKLVSIENRKWYLTESRIYVSKVQIYFIIIQLQQLKREKNFF